MGEMIGKCKYCNKIKWSIKKRERNTAYVDTKANYLKACKDCQKRDDEYFAERWAEYYSGCL